MRQSTNTIISLAHSLELSTTASPVPEGEIGINISTYPSVVSVWEPSALEVQSKQKVEINCFEMDYSCKKAKKWSWKDRRNLLSKLKVK